MIPFRISGEAYDSDPQNVSLNTLFRFLSTTNLCWMRFKSDSENRTPICMRSRILTSQIQNHTISHYDLRLSGRFHTSNRDELFAICANTVMPALSDGPRNVPVARQLHRI